MFARDAAFAAFEEEERGTIAPGKRADLTVFTRDVTAMPPAEILRHAGRRMTRGRADEVVRAMLTLTAV